MSIQQAVREIPFARPIIGDEERRAVEEVLKGHVLVHGPRAHEFEEKFSRWVKGGHAVSVSSCTAALHLCYFYNGLGAGDEVIVPAQTHVATAHAVELCGGKPVFVDAEIETGNIDIAKIEAAITPRTKAISIVHFLGMPVAMDRVMDIAKKHKLYVVEDCALAIGSFYRGTHAGLWGDAGCFSFYPVKHFTTAEGGMVLSRHEEMAKKLARQKAFGVDRHMGERSVPGVYDVTMLGFNYRMNEVQAVLGIGQLDRIDGFLKTRKKNYEALAHELEGTGGIRLFRSSHGDFVSSHYCLSILLEKDLAAKRFEIVDQLKKNGLGTSVYYPKAVPHFQYYRQKYGYDDSFCPVAARISASSISLPVGPHLNEADMKEVAVRVKKAIQGVK